MSGLTWETNYDFQVQPQYSNRWHDYAQVSATTGGMLIGNHKLKGRGGAVRPSTGSGRTEEGLPMHSGFRRNEGDALRGLVCQ